MARDQFIETVGLADIDAAAKPVYRPLSNIQVSVYLPGTTTIATIYQARTGASLKSNPFTTIVGGSVEFWAEYGEYDIKFHDLAIPVRISDKTFGWNATAAGTGAIPSNKIAVDAGLPYGAFAGDAQRQLLPIGAVIDWWRPVNTVPVPAGFAICDGTSTATHDFGTSGSITLPDLRNTFILGANILAADGAAGSSGDAFGNAPGIRGSGGTQSLNAGHTHAIGAHAHALSVAGAHSHAVISSGGTGGANGAVGGGALYATTGNPVATPHQHDITIGGASDTAGAHTHTTDAPSLTTNTAGGILDNRPRYVGLLKIMKVKRS